MKTLFILMSFVLSISAYSQLFDTSSQSEITFKELESRVANSAHIVMGEYHDDLIIQKGQKSIIDSFISIRKNEFSLSWEFLNYSDQKLIDQSVSSLKNKSLSEVDFMKVFYPNGIYQNYLVPITTIKNKGTLLGINAPREWKRLITKDGLVNLDPQYLPPNMEMGTPNYEERFYNALGGSGHAPSEKLIRYYEAQCYTDSVMAWQTEQGSKELNFIMVGSFHSDYGDGLVEQLKKVTSREVITIKIINKNSLTTDQVDLLKAEHPKYGYIADYVFFAE